MVLGQRRNTSKGRLIGVDPQNAKKRLISRAWSRDIRRASAANITHVRTIAHESEWVNGREEIETRRNGAIEDLKTGEVE
jgi:hypothetical protein